jgi:hypothetical protein
MQKFLAHKIIGAYEVEIVWVGPIKVVFQLEHLGGKCSLVKTAFHKNVRPVFGRLSSKIAALRPPIFLFSFFSTAGFELFYSAGWQH